jgi:acyl carrier protein
VSVGTCEGGDVTNDVDELRTVIIDLLDDRGDEPGSGGGVLEDGTLDMSSLELVRLLVAIEDRLGIELDDVAIMNTNLETTDDIVGLVSRSLQGGQVSGVH